MIDRVTCYYCRVSGLNRTSRIAHECDKGALQNRIDELLRAESRQIEAMQSMIAEFQPGQSPDSEENYTPAGLAAIEQARQVVKEWMESD